MIVVLGGFAMPTGGVTADRADGTLLRAKATPNGILAYFVGRIVACVLTTLLTFTVILVAGIIIVPDLVVDARTGLLVTLIFAVGMLSGAPFGVALGSMVKSPSQTLLVTLGITIIVCLSGFEFRVRPPWLQTFVQAFPAYWVALGLRSALGPEGMIAADIGKWRLVEVFAVPGVWAGIGLLLTPSVLRRMARRQSPFALPKLRARTTSIGQ
jgi:ABC-2 type transport system permease protein